MVKNNAKKGTKTYNLIEAYNTVLNAYHSGRDSFDGFTASIINQIKRK